jgi:hypothetical protein
MTFEDTYPDIAAWVQAVGSVNQKRLIIGLGTAPILA